MSPAGLVLLTLAWSAAVWLGAHLLCRLGPSPQQAQAIWRAAGALLLAPFAAALVAPGLAPFTAAPLPEAIMLEPLFVQPGAGAEQVPAAAPFLPDLATLLAAILVAGWAFRLGLWAISQLRLQRLKARALRVDRQVSHWAGILRPAVFVPAALINTHHAQQVIVHELVHQQRGDLLARPLERVVADLFWFTPFAWMIRERLDYWREVVVDEVAAGFTGDRIAYARALTRAAQLARPVTMLPVAALVLKKEGNLKMRLNELLSETPRPPRRMGLAVAAALALAAPVAFAQGMLIKGASSLPVSGLAYSHAVLDKAKLTSAFGLRMHPITGEQKLHGGVDLAEEEGKPVYAPAAGTVTRAEFTEGYGNLVEVASGNTTLRFGQLESMSVKPGDTVTPGKVLGAVGQTGKATGPHLHFEVIRDGVPVDPQAEEGLVLAETLRVMPGAAPLAPVAPAPFTPVVAPAAPVPEAAPTPGVAAPAAPPPGPAGSTQPAPVAPR
jgi:murein DD-endopeptidase MepM/ murein hydrolase activator NlpD